MRAVPALFLASLLACPAHAQAPCGTWTAAFGPPGLDQPIDAYATHDDGSGPALYAGGRFRTIGDQRIDGVARWDGSTWTQVGNGLPDTQRLASYDDGTGAKLYAGGAFRVAQGAPADGFARWNGTSWSAVPGGPVVQPGGIIGALAVRDEGSGPRLFVAGIVHVGAPQRSVVRFDGSAWTDLSSGLPSPSVTSAPSSLAWFDGGSGSALYVGLRGPIPSTAPVWRRSGASWVAASNGIGGSYVTALMTYGSGAASRLYATGQFLFGGTRHAIAVYDGSTWTAVGAGLTMTTDWPIGEVLTVHDDGAGAKLVAGGSFDRAGALAVRGLATFDGTAWSVPGSPLEPDYAVVRALHSHDEGGGPALHVGGNFTLAGREPAQNAAYVRAYDWHPIVAGQGATAAISTLEAIDDGGGQVLYVSGGFDGIGAAAIGRIARWNGVTWDPLGHAQGTDGAVNAFVAFDDGTGRDLYAIGSFTRIGGVTAPGFARWNGTNWTAPGPGLGGVPKALAVFDDGTGGALYGATYSHQMGVPTSWTVARWNGASWTPIAFESSAAIADLIVHDDGGGARLYACGSFASVGGTAVAGIARWDGTAWSAVGSSTLLSAQQVHELEVHDSGAGPQLFVAGHFVLAGAPNGSTVARWDGGAWTEVADATSSVACLKSYRDVSGPRLAAAVTVVPWPEVLWTLRAWDGATWADLGQAERGYPRRLARFDAQRDGVEELYLGGDFATAGGGAAGNLARYDPCGTSALVACAGDGTGVACPCANPGAAGHGCANSFHPGGARLASGGFASIAADTLHLLGTEMPNSSCLYFQGTAAVGGGLGAAFGDGLRCASGAVIRLGMKANVAGASAYPASGDASISVRGANAPGSVRTYQCWYRNAAAYCTPSTFNLTNGITIAWSS